MPDRLCLDSGREGPGVFILSPWLSTPFGAEYASVHHPILDLRIEHPAKNRSLDA